MTILPPSYPQRGPDPDETERLSGELASRLHGLAAEVRRRLGSGSPLQPEQRRAFEGLLGQDLSPVRVHRAPLAGRLAAAAQADALTAGSHVLGSAQQLDSGTRRGAALLGHEVTHAAQAGSAALGAPSSGAPGGLAVQRAGEEDRAQGVEQSVLDGQEQPPAPPVDPELLADLVYRRLMDDLRRERERMAWPS